MSNTMHKKSLDLCLQIIEPQKNIPTKSQFSTWITQTLKKCNISEPYALTIRIVPKNEIQQLNKDYRKHNKPTNILSFQDEIIPGYLRESLGELVVCPEVIAKEAYIEKKPLLHHWAHIIIHGTLHLLGYTHDTDAQAMTMEKLEKAILDALLTLSSSSS